MKEGWKPQRTIILCSWDAEEYGLIGSTEWAEEYAAELREKAVAYLNLDAAVSGSNFSASSVPSLWKVIRAVTRDVKDPKSGKSVYQTWRDRARESRPEGEQNTGGEARITALGSGSDYTPFLQHLGVRPPTLALAVTICLSFRLRLFYWMDVLAIHHIYHVACTDLGALCYGWLMQLDCL